MASNFPSSLDAFTNPSSTDAMDSVSVPHATQHSDLNDAVEALEAKVGADSSAVSSSHDYKIAQLEAGATGGKILQIVSTAKTDTFSTTSTSFTDITGLSVSITPTSSSSKVFVMLTIGQIHVSADYNLEFDVTRAGTPIGVGDTAGSRIRAGISVSPTVANRGESAAWSYLDSPSTTSATTYQTRCQVGGGTLHINRSNSDSDSSSYARTVSTLTVMEVSA